MYKIDKKSYNTNGYNNVSIIDSRGVEIMETKKSMALIAIGIGGTLLYQQIKNGNAKKCLRNMTRTMKKTYDDLEDMM